MPQFFDCQQGSEEWFALRAGIPTASRFDAVRAVGRNGESKTRRTYMLQLAGEILTGTPMVTYSNDNMERGKAMEAEAREVWAFYNETTPDHIGFIKHGRAGCSPDALVGNDGLLEIKTALPHLHLEMLLKGEFPPQHKAQCQGALWIAHREWIDLAIYWPGLPLFVKRAYRDAAYIGELEDAVASFLIELDSIVERVRNFGYMPAAPTFADQLRASLALSEETP